VVYLASAPIFDNFSEDEYIQGVSFERRKIVVGLEEGL
jgi:hypothetical protein